MLLANRVRVARRFQRSIRIDTDNGRHDALEGFICPPSSAEVVEAMARHVSHSNQGAFTWTGPYGSGKSSLVIALSALLSGSAERREQAAAAVGIEIAETVWKALPYKTQGWAVLPVVGRRDRPADVIGEALEAAKFWKGKPPSKGWNEATALAELKAIAEQNPRSRGGLILFLDEMGKFLEAAAYESADIHIFQQIAEFASRSEGRLIVVGILHQAFEQYAHRLSREMRDEWSKIQGRFVDLAVNTAGEEQLSLLARAIESDHVPDEPGKLTVQVANVIREVRPGVSAQIATTLENCWPLNPIVAALLGPLSRRRFGQNQRSIFGFLNSAEAEGFQEFIQHSEDGALYNPDRLWDYLRSNLEAAILPSPDGHRWSLAVDAVERCEGLGGDRVQMQLIKSIALIDLFKERSGLIANSELLRSAVPGVSAKKIRDGLSQLLNWSLIVYRKFSGSFAIFAGSDFDIEHAVERELEEIQEVDLSVLQNLIGLQPVLAKRHYHETGTLRWFDMSLIRLEDVIDSAANFTPQAGTIGQFLLAVPTNSESDDIATRLCWDAARTDCAWDNVIGQSNRSHVISDLTKELIALEAVAQNSPELASDDVARRELRARVAAVQGQLELELSHAFEGAQWHVKGRKKVLHLSRLELQRLASDLTDARFELSPRLHNELLNRIKPSGSAVAAQKALLRRMVEYEGDENLAIEGFPAERGLFASLLEATGLYNKVSGTWRFLAPQEDDDPCRLAPLWHAADRYLQERKSESISLSEIYDLWKAEPFGLRDGLLPVIAVAFILARRELIAFYRQGLFQSRVTDLDIDYMTKDPRDIQLRWMDISATARQLLSGMADLVRELDDDNKLENLEPIDVARGLIAVYDHLPPWTKKTMQLSRNALRIRQLFKQAIDPNKFLFDDIPELFSAVGENDTEASFESVIEKFRQGVLELKIAYPGMLHRVRFTILSELQVPNASEESLTELNERAENIRNLGGDFTFAAFVGRIAAFDDSDESIEGLINLATNKPTIKWVDSDIERAEFELAKMAQNFIQSEVFAHVKGRTDRRHAMAVVVGIDGRPTPLHEEFDISDADRKNVDELVATIEAAIDSADSFGRNVILAAFAELAASYLKDTESQQTSALNPPIREVTS